MYCIHLPSSLLDQRFVQRFLSIPHPNLDYKNMSINSTKNKTIIIVCVYQMLTININYKYTDLINSVVILVIIYM